MNRLLFQLMMSLVLLFTYVLVVLRGTSLYKYFFSDKVVQVNGTCFACLTN
jgi:hypothetical protein